MKAISKGFPPATCAKIPQQLPIQRDAFLPLAFTAKVINSNPPPAAVLQNCKNAASSALQLPGEKDALLL